MISLPLPSGTFLGSSSSGHNLGDFKGQWKFCHLLPFSLIRKHQVWNRFHSSLYYSIEKIHPSSALLRAGISSYEQVACKTWPKVAVLSSPTSCTWSRLHHREQARNTKRITSHQVAGTIPKAKGMFPHKETPEFMTEKLQMEINRKKQTYKRKQTNPKREPHNFDYFSDFALY